MNTNATTAWRAKWATTGIQESLKVSLVAEKICKVDRTEDMYIWNPYGSAPTTTIQAITTVTYTPAAYTTTNDTLTITDTFVVSEQIYDYEKVLNNYDLYASRIDEMNASVAAAIDKWVLNNLCEDGTGTYTTPAGGFSAGNVGTIISEIWGKVAGYDITGGLFCVIESTDLPGVLQYESTAGFNYQDAVMNNGFVKNIMGVDIYVVRSGIFVSDTLGTTAVTNSGHRVAGVKNLATYAAPRGVQYAEKDITGYLGKELVIWGYVGFKAWYAKKSLIIDITLA